MQGKYICNFVFLTLLYSIFLLEFDYIDPGNHYGYPIMSLGYVVGLLFIMFSKTPKGLGLKTMTALYAVSVVFSCLLVDSNGGLSQILINIIKNTEWVIVFALAFYVGVKYKSLDFFSKLVSYFLLPVIYVLYYLLLTRTFFVGEEEGFRDAIFPVLMLTPFVLLQKNKLKYVHIVISLALVLISAKRSAIIAIVLAYGIYFIINYSVLGKEQAAKRLRILVPMVIIVGILYYLSTKGLFGIGLDRFRAINDDSGSGRDLIYGPLLSSFEQSSIWEQLFGHGTSSTRAVVDKLAHNDFLQVLYDYGVISWALFTIIYVGFIRMAFKMRRRINEFRDEYSVYIYNLILFVVIGFLNCFVSSPHVFSASILCFGFIIGRFYSLNQSKT